MGLYDKLTAQQKDAVKAGVILGLVLLGGAYAFHTYYTKPDVKRNQDLQNKLQGEIGFLVERLKEMDRARANMEAMREKQRLLEQVAAKLPSSIAPTEFYQALEEILANTRINYTELTQQAPQNRDIYTEIPYRLVAKGRYHDFGQYLNMIEENPKRLMRVKTFTVENNDARPSVHPITVEIATFMFNQRG